MNDELVSVLRPMNKYFADNDLCECGHTWKRHRESIAAEVCSECACWWFAPKLPEPKFAHRIPLTPHEDDEPFDDGQR